MESNLNPLSSNSKMVLIIDSFYSETLTNRVNSGGLSVPESPESS